MIFLLPKKDKRNKRRGHISLIIKNQAGRCNKGIANLHEIGSSMASNILNGRYKEMTS